MASCLFKLENKAARLRGDVYEDKGFCLTCGLVMWGYDWGGEYHTYVDEANAEPGATSKAEECAGPGGLKGQLLHKTIQEALRRRDMLSLDGAAASGPGSNWEAFSSGTKALYEEIAVEVHGLITGLTNQQGILANLIEGLTEEQRAHMLMGDWKGEWPPDAGTD